jgi:hypothetical protein
MLARQSASRLARRGDILPPGDQQVERPLAAARNSGKAMAATPPRPVDAHLRVPETAPIDCEFSKNIIE